MATQHLPLFGWNTRADTTGRAYFAPYDNYATNLLFKHHVLVLENPSSNIHGVYGQFQVPEDYVDTAVMRVLWTTQVTTGTVVFFFNYRAVGGNDTESLDQATFQEQIDIQDVAPSAIDERMNVSGSVTDSNFAAGDSVGFFFGRDGVVGVPDDDLADAVQVVELIFEYADA